MRYLRTRSDYALMTAIWVVVIGFWGVIGFVAWHFIAKYW